MSLKFKVTMSIVALNAMALVACGSSESLDNSDAAEDTIVIGSQDYYSNEIIAEIYAQALEAHDIEVQRDFRIGQREVYMPEIENGSVDLFPEYSGPLLQYWEPEPQARRSEDVYAALVDATPDGLKVLNQADATDQDSYVVTREFAEANGLTTIADLAKVTGPLVLGANSEAENRPNGPKGLKEAYGIDAGFTPIEDSGGPLTVKAMKDGTVQLAIIYSADPSIKQNDLVVLEDPEGLFLASHVVPIASEELSEEAQEVINKVNKALTSAALVSLNAKSIEQQAPASTIATEWLEQQQL